jgi:hypothetical protein
MAPAIVLAAIYSMRLVLGLVGVCVLTSRVAVP